MCPRHNDLYSSFPPMLKVVSVKIKRKNWTGKGHTRDMINGWLKSSPPVSRNPQGAGPGRTTFCGMFPTNFWQYLKRGFLWLKSCPDQGACQTSTGLLGRTAAPSVGFLEVSGFCLPPSVSPLYLFSWVTSSVSGSLHPEGKYQLWETKIWTLLIITTNLLLICCFPRVSQATLGGVQVTLSFLKDISIKAAWLLFGCCASPERAFTSTLVNYCNHYLHKNIHWPG